MLRNGSNWLGFGVGGRKSLKRTPSKAERSEHVNTSTRQHINTPKLSLSLALLLSAGVFVGSMSQASVVLCQRVSRTILPLHLKRTLHPPKAVTCSGCSGLGGASKRSAPLRCCCSTQLGVVGKDCQLCEVCSPSSMRMFDRKEYPCSRGSFWHSLRQSHNHQKPQQNASHNLQWARKHR